MQIKIEELRSWTLEECEAYCREKGITMAELFCDPEKETIVQLPEEDRRFIHRFLSMSTEDRDLIAQLIDKMSGKGKPSPKCPK